MVQQEIMDLLEESAEMLSEDCVMFRQSHMVPGSEKWDAIDSVSEYASKCALVVRLREAVHELKSEEK